ncbi:MAG: exodeoxyribonuclease VII large subunit [Candidatus Omnitrophica bacterium]|nr:exodeoxyribonuclease VII large subunit [Candidatus Omnitrophota bacterium]
MKKETRHIYKVSELAREARMLLEGAFSAVWVEGEISNLLLHSSGHMYFSLKDEAAVLSCAMFRPVNQQLKFAPKEGMQVLCLGRVSIYDKQGKYQLYVQAMEPNGAGALQIAFEQLKEKLQKEGLFDKAHKKPIPFLPQRIGIVTSPTGAAIRDILNILRRRFPNVEIILNPVRVQGDGASAEIANAIKEFNEYGKIDVLIVGRGGGSIEDLWAFNEEIVARAIYDSKIPVVSAVGHEIDFTIADFVADMRAPTPSAAAELVVPEKKEMASTLETNSTRLANGLLNRLNALKEKLNRLKTSYVLRQPLNLVLQLKQRIDDLGNDLAVRMGHVLELSMGDFKTLIGRLEALSPLAILGRGYSITFNKVDGKIIKNAAPLKCGDRVETRVCKGKFISIVDKITD